MKSEAISFVGVLQIAFIVLKLCKVITWSWWIVMLPTIINIAILGIAVVICLLASKH